jgi:hypothetical protein
MGIKVEAMKMVPKTICKEVMVPAEEKENKKQPTIIQARSGGSVKGRPAKRSAENS